MAPSTPDNSPKRSEFDTIPRTRFYHIYDCKQKDASLGAVCDQLDFHLLPTTARSWLGRKSKVSAADLKKITNQDDPIHNKPYEQQVQTLENKPSTYTLQRHAYQDGARRYPKGYTAEILKTNKPNRVKYGQKHENETLTVTIEA